VTDDAGIRQLTARRLARRLSGPARGPSATTTTTTSAVVTGHLSPTRTPAKTTAADICPWPALRFRVTELVAMVTVRIIAVGVRIIRRITAARIQDRVRVG